MTPARFQEIVYEVCGILDIPYPWPSVKLKMVHSGRYRPKTHRITLPTWILGHNEWYQAWYVIHEACHAKTSGRHNEIFKAAERLALRHFDMVPVYKKAYVKRLTNKLGLVLWEEDKNDSRKETEKAA